MLIALLEPTASVLGLSTYAAHNILEPLGLEYLASYLESVGHDARVVQQRCEERAITLARIVGLCPAVLAISTQTYNIDDALWFASGAKAAIPGLRVVLGGYHASAVPELVEHPDVDFVVIGEGEVVLGSILSALADGRSTNSIAGVAYSDGSVHVNLRAPRIDDLDALPFPKRNGSTLSQCRMHGLMYPPPSRQIHVGMITATRGCPYSCSFCSSEVIWNKQVRRRSPENVGDELEVLAGEFGVNAVFFCDLTFNADRAYCIRLCEEIAKRNAPIHFYAMCNLKGMDREIAEALAAAKCVKVGFGVESFIDATRTQIKDGGGMDLDGANRVVDEVAEAGVLTKCYFIVGFPWETQESLAQLQEDIGRLHADEIKATFYVPFPGTRGYKAHSALLATEKWSALTTLSEPVVQNDNVSAEKLKRIRKDIFDQFYNGSGWPGRVARRVACFPQYRDSFAEFADFLRSRGILTSKLPSLEANECKL